MRKCIKCGKDSFLVICEMCSLDGRLDEDSELEKSIKSEKSSAKKVSDTYKSFLSFVAGRYSKLKDSYNKGKSMTLYRNPSTPYSGLNFTLSYANSSKKSSNANYSGSRSYSK